MSEKKIYFVTVEIRQEIVVAADSKREAEQVAFDHYEEDFDLGNERDVEIGIVVEVNAPGDFRGTLPWGVENSDPRRDWPIERWLEAQEETAHD